MRSACAVLAAILSAFSFANAQRFLYTGIAPGAASAERHGNLISLANRALRVTWDCGDAPRAASMLIDRANGRIYALGDPVRIVFRDGHSASLGKPLGPTSIKTVQPSSRTPRASERLKGVAAEADYAVEGLTVHWRAILLDGSNYVRQEVTLQSKGVADIAQIRLIDASIADARVSGTVLGSPVVTDTLFCGMEHPMSVSKAEDGHVTCSLDRKLPLSPNVPVIYSSVFGVSPTGQLRRSFLHYLERERARPYAPFLHYNSWYDIGYFTVYKEPECLDAIDAFGAELSQKRSVKLASFLFDDGWDDRSTVWEFHSGFPHGFTPIKEHAAKFGAEPGIWLSPWGGYGKPHDERVATAKRLGFETDVDGLALSGPKYYGRFHDMCLDLVGKYGINQFKLDGTGDPDKQFPGSPFASDFEAAIQLIGDLRAAKPNLFINLTTGTWPSPFWTRYADSIWRGGYDHSFIGVGTKRQQWVTYRDADTYRGIIQQGPLYPVTSLMLHGLIYAKHAHDLQTDPGNDFASEVHDYFGNGTQLQEMYISHSLMTKQNWDDLAEAAKWSAANQDILVDSHWVGGDPLKLQVYGWASWSPRKSILVLRNPSDRSQSMTVDLKAMLELPAGAKISFLGRSPWATNRSAAPEAFGADGKKSLTLKPFEVRVLELSPRR